MHWLKGLDEAEPPRNLVHNILAQTIGALPSEHVMPAPRGEGWLEKLKGRLAPVFAPVVTPRFAMSFGMAFFSITMLLGIAGFHFADVRHLDLSSKGITKTYYETQARVMRYYENMRLVYEIESRVRDLRRAATPDSSQDNKQQQQEAPAPNPNPKNPSKSDNRQHNRSNPNYSRDNGEPLLATFPAVIVGSNSPGPARQENRMNCANHLDAPAVAYCRTCGKPLCSACTRDVRGVIYCEECLASHLSGTMPPPAQPPCLRCADGHPTRPVQRWLPSWDSFPASAPCTTANLPKASSTC